jgi:uncharacterized protein
MANNVFVDSGAFIARANPGDQHSESARNAWELIRTADTVLFSSEPVLVESANYLVRAQGCRFAAQWIRRHLDTTEIRWLQPGREDFDEAAGDLQKFSDQRISFTDATSFALMRRHRIDRVFGFDRHFTMAGFALWPEN